jgi:hypothetical protein
VCVRQQRRHALKPILHLAARSLGRGTEPAAPALQPRIQLAAGCFSNCALRVGSVSWFAVRSNEIVVQIFAEHLIVFEGRQRLTIRWH